MPTARRLANISGSIPIFNWLSFSRKRFFNSSNLSLSTSPNCPSFAFFSCSFFVLGLLSLVAFFSFAFTPSFPAVSFASALLPTSPLALPSVAGSAPLTPLSVWTSLRLSLYSTPAPYAVPCCCQSTFLSIAVLRPIVRPAQSLPIVPYGH